MATIIPIIPMVLIWYWNLAWFSQVYLSCHVACFHFLDDRSIDDVVYSIFGQACLVQQASVETKINHFNSNHIQKVLVLMFYDAFCFQKRAFNWTGLLPVTLNITLFIFGSHITILIRYNTQTMNHTSLSLKKNKLWSYAWLIVFHWVCNSYSNWYFWISYPWYEIHGYGLLRFP